MRYELTGKIKVIQEPQTFASGFTKKCLVVLDDSGKFEQEIVFEFLQDKVSLLDNLSEGMEVKVSFDVRGREHQGKWYNSLVGWRIDSNAAQAGETASQPPAEQPTGIDDDIPF